MAAYISNSLASVNLDLRSAGPKPIFVENDECCIFIWSWRQIFHDIADTMGMVCWLPNRFPIPVIRATLIDLTGKIYQLWSISSLMTRVASELPLSITWC